MGEKDETMKMDIKGEGIEQVEKFRWVGRWIAKDVSCTAEIRLRIALEKEDFNRNRRLFC